MATDDVIAAQRLFQNPPPVRRGRAGWGSGIGSATAAKHQAVKLLKAFIAGTDRSMNMNWLLWMVRPLLRLPRPRITSAHAVEIAIAEATRRAAPPIRPGHAAPLAQERLRDWAVWLEPDIRPCRIVVIDNQTGEVKAYVAPPR